jgi:hypothetical protein
MTPRRIVICGVCVNARFLYSIPAHSPQLEGFSSIARNEGIRGLWRGTLLGLFGVTNGAIQFMAYEKMKDWAFARRRVQAAKTGKEPDDKLVRFQSCSTAHDF